MSEVDKAKANLQSTRDQIIKELADDPGASFEQVKNLCDTYLVIEKLLNYL
jgi:hypothetical protein